MGTRHQQDVRYSSVIRWGDVEERHRQLFSCERGFSRLLSAASHIALTINIVGNNPAEH